MVVCPPHFFPHKISKQQKRQFQISEPGLFFSLLWNHALCDQIAQCPTVLTNIHIMHVWVCGYVEVLKRTSPGRLTQSPLDPAKAWPSASWGFTTSTRGQTSQFVGEDGRTICPVLEDQMGILEEVTSQSPGDCYEE
jgi:hypothetical protein